MTIARRDALAFAALIAATVLLVAIDPPGYFGGRWDDGRYLEAALAWVADGPQLGTDHWSLRWPVVLPAAWSIEHVGRTRAALMLPGLIVFFALLTINFWAARRVLGLAAAVLASAALVTTSDVLLSATRLTADLPELLFWTAGAWAFVFATRTDGQARAAWLLASGIGAGLAWSVRETSAALPLALGIAFVAGVLPRALFGWIALGFAAVALPEQALLWHASGDPLYRLHVDMRHVEIPSNNLRGLVANGAPPAMNFDVMSRWSGVGPIHLHYLIDPWINLFLNGRYGLDFLIAGIAVFAARHRLSQDDRRAIAVLAGLAALHIAFVVYVIATDPKPRMFMPAIVAACLIIGIALPPAWRAGARAWPIALVAAKLLLLLVTIDITAVYRVQYASLAEAALRGRPGVVYADRWTLSALALAGAQVRDRLRPGPPPVGGLLLITANRGDKIGDNLPDPGLRWQRIAEFAGPRRAYLARWAEPLIPAGSRLAKLASDATPVATLWRRLPPPPA